MVALKAGDVGKLKDTLIESRRIRYSAKIFSQQAPLTVAGYRYSTKDYYALRMCWIPGSDNSHYDHAQSHRPCRRSQDTLSTVPFQFTLYIMKITGMTLIPHH